MGRATGAKADRLHEVVDGAVDGLVRLLPVTVPLVLELHELIETAAPALRGTTTALLHGDVSMWNIIVAPVRATVIDWDDAAVGDPARELALLGMHASLFNCRGLPRGFFNCDGRGPIEPNTSLHRLIGTVWWLTSDDWDAFERLDPDLRARTRDWFRELLGWTARLLEHVAQLQTLLPLP